LYAYSQSITAGFRKGAAFVATYRDLVFDQCLQEIDPAFPPMGKTHTMIFFSGIHSSMKSVRGFTPVTAFCFAVMAAHFFVPWNMLLALPQR